MGHSLLVQLLRLVAGWLHNLSLYCVIAQFCLQCIVLLHLLLSFMSAQGWQVSAEGGLNRGLNRSGRNRFLPVSANVNFDVNS